ncbi:hypothetical protein J132_05348 [Termitomyces sp. J132]|nr:hypothetical protein J132_05348 [Termitomyces sp. J132]
MVAKQEKTFAWEDSKQGSLRPDFFLPVHIPTIPHILWVQHNYPIPPGLEKEVCEIIHDKISAGVDEPSNSAYHSQWFCVLKKNGKLRIVHSLEPLNHVTIRHSGVPPFPDHIAESFAGRICGATLNLYIGYDEVLQQMKYCGGTFSGPKSLKDIANLQADRKKMLNNPDIPEEVKREEAVILDEKIQNLEMSHFVKVRDIITMNYFVNGETLMKPWINMNKVQKMRDNIAALKAPQQPLERKSAKMAELAESHHNAIQKEDIPTNERDHQRRMRKVLSNIKVKLSRRQKEDMKTPLQYQDIEDVTQALKNGKAVGLDGIVQELWKELAMH